MADLQFSSSVETRSVVGSWTIRIGVAAFFIIFGLEKFSDDPASHWVRLFRQIGAGEWFRYVTGVSEVLGGLLVLIPRTALAGLALLIATMLGAVLIVAVVLHQPGDSIFPAFFLVCLIGVAVWVRRSRSSEL